MKIVDRLKFTRFSTGRLPSLIKGTNAGWKNHFSSIVCRFVGDENKHDHHVQVHKDPRVNFLDSDLGYAYASARSVLRLEFCRDSYTGDDCHVALGAFVQHSI